MSEKSKDNFWGGFLLGVIVGGTTAAVVTAILSKNQNDAEADLEAENPMDGIAERNLHNQPEGDRIRQNLEQKIVQLNQAIDAVSQEMQGSSQNVPKGGNPTTLKQES